MILLFADLNFQLRLRTNPDCGQYIQSDTVLKTTDITIELSQRVNSLCGCGFNSSLILRPFIRCFDDSPRYVTYRAVLTGTPTDSTVELVSFIDQWIATTETIIVQSAGLSTDSTCLLVIVDHESPECPQDLTNRLSLATSATLSEDNTGALVGGVIGGAVVLVAMVGLVSILVILLKYVRSGSKDMTTKYTNCK